LESNSGHLQEISKRKKGTYVSRNRPVKATVGRINRCHEFFPFQYCQHLGATDRDSVSGVLLRKSYVLLKNLLKLAS